MKEYLSAPDKVVNPLVEEFKESEEYRYAYAEEHLNTTIALQIRALRDIREMKQSELAAEIGTQQPGIARLENVNYARWNIETLKKVARALGVRLKNTFETFGTLLEEDATFSREALERPKFEDDPAFKNELAIDFESATQQNEIPDSWKPPQPNVSNITSQDEFLRKRSQSEADKQKLVQEQTRLELAASGR